MACTMLVMQEARQYVINRTCVTAVRPVRPLGSIHSLNLTPNHGGVLAAEVAAGAAGHKGVAVAAAVAAHCTGAVGVAAVVQKGHLRGGTGQQLPACSTPTGVLSLASTAEARIRTEATSRNRRPIAGKDMVAVSYRLLGFRGFVGGPPCP